MHDGISSSYFDIYMPGCPNLIHFLCLVSPYNSFDGFNSLFRKKSMEQQKNSTKKQQVIAGW